MKRGRIGFFGLVRADRVVRADRAVRVVGAVVRAQALYKESGEKDFLSHVLTAIEETSQGSQDNQGRFVRAVKVVGAKASYKESKGNDLSQSCLCCHRRNRLRLI